MEDSFSKVVLSRSQLPPSIVLTGGEKTALAIGLAGTGVVALAMFAPWTLALVGGLVILGLSIVESEALLIAIIFLMPFSWMLRADLSVRNAYEVIHLVVAGGFFAGWWLRGQLHIRRLCDSTVSRASVLFVCVAAACSVIGNRGLTHQALRSDIDLVSFLVFYFVVLLWADSRERIRKILWTLLLSTLATGIFALFQIVVGGFTPLWFYLNPPDSFFVVRWEGRAASFLSSPNNLAGYLNLIVPFALACYVLGEGRWKTLGGCTFGFGLIALFSTQGIGGLLGLVGFLVCAIFYLVRGTWKKVLSLTALCVTIVLLYLLKDVLNPIHTDQLLATDMITRLLLWRSAWNLFLQFPLFGVGWGNFTVAYVPDISGMEGILAAHNLYFQLLADTGMLGFCGFFFLIAQAARQAQRQWRSSGDFLDHALAFGVLGALVSVLVHGFVDFLFQTNVQFGTLFWCLLALLIANIRVGRKEKRELPAEVLH